MVGLRFWRRGPDHSPRIRALSKSSSNKAEKKKGPPIGHSKHARTHAHGRVVFRQRRQRHSKCHPKLRDAFQRYILSLSISVFTATAPSELFWRILYRLPGPCVISLRRRYVYDIIGEVLALAWHLTLTLTFLRNKLSKSANVRSKNREKGVMKKSHFRKVVVPLLIHWLISFKLGVKFM